MGCYYSFIDLVWECKTKPRSLERSATHLQLEEFAKQIRQDYTRKY